MQSNFPEPRFPSLEEIVALHEISIRRYGGASGVKSLGLVESALMSIQQTFGGQYLYQTIAEMAGALWHGLACNHGFVDGNKRIALAATDLFLQYNGLQLNLSNEAAEKTTLRIASIELSRDDLVAMMPNMIEPRRAS